MHGQVKQSDNFAFVRVYESGHEVPFYQPVLALELFERAINGKDIATGEKHWKQYKSVGPAESTYREGNGTMQFAVLPANATYNTTTNAPNPVNGTNGTAAISAAAARQDIKKKAKRMFKPSYQNRR